MKYAINKINYYLFLIDFFNYLLLNLLINEKSRDKMSGIAEWPDRFSIHN